MTPTGSRFLFAAATLATIGAVVYGITQEGSLGTVGLIERGAGPVPVGRGQPLHARRRRVVDGSGRHH